MRISKRITGMFLAFIMMLCITLNFPIKASAETVTVTTLGADFSYPEGVAVDKSGNIYVGSFDGTIKKMDSSGNNIVTIGTGFSDPQGVAVDKSGNIYVADGGNSITKMDSSGNNIVTIGADFSYPKGVAVDKSGNIYVADAGNKSITKMDSSGNNIVTIGTGFSSPCGVAVDNSGNIYVVDYYNNSITKMDSSGNNIVMLGAEFFYPMGVAVDNSGNIYVADNGNRSIKKMDSSGKNIVTLETDLSNPMGVAVDNSGNIYVADSNNDAIKKIQISSSYSVTYNGNGSTGGTAPTDSSSYTPSSAITVKDNTGGLVKAGYSFVGWNTVADGSGTNYAAAATFSMGSANVTLYAQWILSSSTITPITANFDKYASGTNYVDIPVTMTLSGNTLSSIAKGTNTLVAGTDYVVSGSTVTINKTYLAAQSVGTTNLTFKFNAGADQNLVVTVADTTPASSTITPITANFDKYASGTNYADIPVTMTLNGNTLSSIKNGTNTLVEGTDYVVSGNTVTINKTYLVAQPVGTTNLTFKFSAGADQSLAVTVADTTPGNSIITPTTGNFDKYASGANYVDIPVIMTLNGNSLISIKNGTVSLIENIDYTTTGSAITIKKEYLATQAVGTTNLTFTFSAGAAKNLAIIINDTTVPAETTYTLTYIAGANGSITGITLQTVNSGASGTAVTAVPNTGYHFVNWSDGLATVTRTDSNVTTSSSITANFAETSSSSGGSTSGGTASTPTTTVTGSVVDNKTGETIKGIPAQVTVATDGTKTVEVKSQESIVFKEPDGTKNTLSDLTKLSFSLPVTTNDGSTTTNNNAASITLKADGTIQVNGLANGTETKFSVTFDLGNGQKITIGSMAVKVASDGTVSLTSTLIDPYGIITDPTTGKAVAGANVTLYYANTDRNKAAGKIPGTVVPLPTIDGFKPNNNINPQVSDASGAYGFMVFPTSDYYIIATKDGYNKYTSPMISVEQEIVKWDFQMFPLASGVNRISGNGRVDTALEIAKASFKVKVPNVVLATATDYPDALAGSVLAYKLNAPILLVGSSEEDQAKVLDYIKANLDSAGTVYILGGTGAVSKDMETKITANGFNNINRIGGADRYETSLKIADAMKVATGTPIIIASGDNYPDALSVSSAATLNQYPILLVKGNEMPSSIMNEISLIKPGKVYIIGLQGAISDAVEAEVSQTGVVDKANVIRIGGANRYETSLEVAKYFNLGGKLACVATGNNFPDALAGSVYAAKNLAPIILVDKSLSENQLKYLKNNNLSGTTIFGGEGAVSKDLKQQLGQLFGK